MQKVDIAELRRLHQAAAFASDEWDDSARGIYNALPAILDELEAARLEMRRQAAVIAEYKGEVERLVDCIFQGEGIDAVGELGITCENFRAWLKERSEERDALRAELAAAKEENAKMRATIISAMVDVQHNLPGNGHAKLSLLLDGIMKAPRNNEERLLAERDRLAADNARLRKALQPFADRIKAYPPWMWTAMIEREKEGIITGGFRAGGEAVTHMPAMLLVQAEEALAATPAQSLAAHDAALLERVKARLYALASKEADQPYGYDLNPRQWAATCLDCAAEDVAAMQEEIQSEADRIAKEAANG